MPALSPTMTEGRLAAWKKAEGDAVAPGDVLAEIETDKATMEVEATDEGTLARILVPAGSEGVPVNTAIATILEVGEDAADLERPAKAAASTPQQVDSAPPLPELAEAPTAPAPAPPTLGGELPPQAAAGSRRALASPLARRLAREAGIDLALVRGTGPGGRIVKADVDGAAPLPVPPRPQTQTPPPVPLAASETESRPHSSVRKIVARRLTEAWTTIPHVFLTVDCELDALLEARRRLNAAAAGEFKLSVTDFVVRASALACGKVPKLNAHWTEAAALQLSEVDVAVAVALDDGLVTPVVRSADTKGLTTISAEVRELAARGRAGKLLPHEYQGGSVTVSNLGMFGVREFGAIINPPQAAILAVGAGEPRVVVRDGAPAVATAMTCTLSCDHRLVDGADGARWLAAFRGFIEEPLTMML